MEKITRTIKVSGGDLPKDVSYEINLTVDYTGVGREELIERAMSNDVIRIQSNLRKTDQKILAGYVKSGLTVAATEVGKRTGGISVRATLKAMGMSEQNIEKFMNNPALVNELLNNMETE